jgi:hypothetical protein
LAVIARVSQGSAAGYGADYRLALTERQARQKKEKRSRGGSHSGRFLHNGKFHIWMSLFL